MARNGNRNAAPGGGGGGQQAQRRRGRHSLPPPEPRRAGRHHLALHARPLPGQHQLRRLTPGELTNFLLILDAKFGVLKTVFCC